MAQVKTAFGDFDMVDVEKEGVETPAAEEAAAGDEGGTPTPEEEAAEDGAASDEEEGSEEGTEEEEEEESEDTLGFDTVVSEMEKEGVFHLGEDDEFEATPEGMAQMMKSNMGKYREKVEAEFKEKYGIDTGADVPEEYYSKLDPENNKDAEALIRANLESTGYTPEEINDAVTDIVSRDKLQAEAKLAQRIVTVKEKQYIKSVEEKNALSQQQRETKRVAAIDAMKSEIDDLDEVSGFALDDDRKAAFKDYLFKVGADGKTQAQRNATDNSRRIKLSFLDFMDANKEDFDIKAKTAVANKLKKKTSRFKPKAAVSGKSVGRQEAKKDEIDFDLIGSIL